MAVIHVSGDTPRRIHPACRGPKKYIQSECGLIWCSRIGWFWSMATWYSRKIEYIIFQNSLSIQTKNKLGKECQHT